MDRIEKINRLKSIEQSIENLKNYKIGIDTSYFNKGKLSMKIDSDDFKFNKDYNNVEIEFSKDLIVKFIETQIEIFEKESKLILEELTNEC